MAQATTKDWLDGIQKGLLKQLTENRGGTRPSPKI